MARTPQPDVDAIADDPTVLLERPGDDAFASVALPRTAEAVPRPTVAPAPPEPAPAPSSAGAPRPPDRVVDAAQEPNAASPARRRPRPLDKLALSAIVVALACALGAGWIIAKLVRG
jgi:hypothetical protein